MELRRENSDKKYLVSFIREEKQCIKRVIFPILKISFFIYIYQLNLNLKEILIFFLI